MDTSRYASFVPATLSTGKYDLRVKRVEDFIGNKVDDNGEVSIGKKFIYIVEGPEENLMSNGTSPLGFQFEELLLEPKASSSPKYVEMCSKKWNQQLKALFGEDIPPVVNNEDYVDKLFTASIRLKYDEYRKGEVPEITFRSPLVAR